MPNDKGDPTPAEAARALREYAISHVAPEHVTAAIAILLDHVVRLEQTVDLIDAGHQSAMRARPDNALLRVPLSDRPAVARRTRRSKQ